MTEKYVIKNNETEEYIAIDNASGGYPYDAPLYRAEIFPYKDAALRYRKVFPKKDWSLGVLMINAIIIPWE